MHCLESTESFSVYQLDVSDDLYLEYAESLLKQGLGGHYTKRNLIDQIQDGNGFLIGLVEESRMLTGVILVKLLKEEKISEYLNFTEASKASVAYIPFIAVEASRRRMGIGHVLFKNTFAYLMTLGFTHLVAEAWDASLSFLKKEGFESHRRIPGYWYEESCHAQDFCVLCGSPCKCDAIIIVKKLTAFSE